MEIGFEDNDDIWEEDTPFKYQDIYADTRVDESGNIISQLDREQREWERYENHPTFIEEHLKQEIISMRNHIREISDKYSELSRLNMELINRIGNLNKIINKLKLKTSPIQDRKLKFRKRI